MKFYRVDSTNYAFLTKSVGKCKGSGLFCKHFDSSENFQVLIYFRYADVKQQNENTEIIQVYHKYYLYRAIWCLKMYKKVVVSLFLVNQYTDSVRVFSKDQSSRGIVSGSKDQNDRVLLKD